METRWEFLDIVSPFTLYSYQSNTTSPLQLSTEARTFCFLVKMLAIITLAKFINPAIRRTALILPKRILPLFLIFLESFRRKQSYKHYSIGISCGVSSQAFLLSLLLYKIFSYEFPFFHAKRQDTFLLREHILPNVSYFLF